MLSKKSSKSSTIPVCLSESCLSHDVICARRYYHPNSGKCSPSPIFQYVLPLFHPYFCFELEHIALEEQGLQRCQPKMVKIQKITSVTFFDPLIHKLLKVEIFRLNLKDSSNRSQKVSPKIQKLSQNKSEKCFLCTFICFAREMR